MVSWKILVEIFIDNDKNIVIFKKINEIYVFFFS